MSRSIEDLRKDLIHYTEVFKRAKDRGGRRMIDGAQWNIDRVNDRIREEGKK